MKIPASELKIGDVIMPPAREVRLWMRRELQRLCLTESALYLIITNIHEGEPDKGGRWLFVTGDQTPEWLAGRKPLPFKFRVRPGSPWQVISKAHTTAA